MAGIFISYRRADSDVAAGRLSDDLEQVFGAEAIFRDVDQLYPGEDYEVAIDTALNSCVVLLAIIGPSWSNAVDARGRRRLEDSKDWVRTEIVRALSRKVRVIPVLISRETMPADSEVPVDLAPLLKRQACELSDRHWKQDLEVLVTTLRNIPGINGEVIAGRPIFDKHATLKLIGSRQWFALQPLISIFLDGQEVSSMKLTEDRTLKVEPGPHDLKLKLSFRMSNTVRFDSLPGQTQAFDVIANRLWGGVQIHPSSS